MLNSAPSTLQINTTISPISVDHWPHQHAQRSIILVHGWGGARRVWRPLANALAADYQVVTLDLGGHGDSPSSQSPWTMARFASEVAAVIDALALHDVVLVGHSMGGAVVTEAALLRPQAVKAVVLVDTFIFDYGHVAADECQAILNYIRHHLAETAQAMVSNTTPAGTADSLRADIANTMAALNPDMGADAFADLLAWDASQCWPRLNGLPVYAINGDFIHAHARQRHQHVIQESLLPSTGHFLHLEAPSRFEAALRDVLQRHTAASA